MAELRRFNSRVQAMRIPEQTEQHGQYLAFSMGGETFAMDIRSIKEVIQFTELTEVPLMPTFIRGVINLRGAVVPVIDLSIRFHRPSTEITHRTCTVILEVVNDEETAVLGVMVDNVNEVLDISARDIEPAPAFGSKLRSEFITGVGKVNGKFVIILDVNRVLPVEEMAALTSTSVVGP